MAELVFYTGSLTNGGNDMMRLVGLALLVASCHHAADSELKKSKCAVSAKTAALLTGAVVDRLKCKKPDQVADTLDVLGNLSCNKKTQITDQLGKSAGSAERTECLILKKRVLTYTGAGAPAEWQCSGKVSLSLLDGVCPAK